LKSLTQKTKNGATIMFPEGLEDTPFTFKIESKPVLHVFYSGKMKEDHSSSTDDTQSSEQWLYVAHEPLQWSMRSH
jgi:hypothetical protein